MDKGDMPGDPRGLIFEAYRMEIGEEDCRAIFLDWALGLDGPVRPQDLQALLDRYAADHPNHPMTAVLRAGLEQTAAQPGRRGRRRDRDVPPETGA